MAKLLVHSVSVLSKNRQQSYALIFACYATLKRRGGGVTKYFDVSSEEKRVNDQDFDTDCRCGNCLVLALASYDPAFQCNLSHSCMMLIDSHETVLTGQDVAVWSFPKKYAHMLTHYLPYKLIIRHTLCSVK